MKPGLTVWLLSGAMLGGAVSCNNIARDNEDVSTRAATLSADSLETMKLSELGSLGKEEAPIATSASDTVPNNVATPPSASSQSDDQTYTETEVVEIDTVATRIVYDVKRRTIEQVDTVGATKTYEIRKRVLKRTVMVDTLTETEDKEQTVAYETGDYKVLNEQVETDSVVEIVDYQKEKQKAAQARTAPSSTTTPAASTAQPSERQSAQPGQSSTQSADTTSTSQSSNSPSTTQGTKRSSTSSQSSTQPADTTSTSRVRTNSSGSTQDTPAQSASPSGTAKQDTTKQRSESGS